MRDPLLKLLRRLGDGVDVSIGTDVTVLTAGARIEGTIARPLEFAEHFDDGIAQALRDVARGRDRAEERGAIEEAAKMYDPRPTATAFEQRLEGRQELRDELATLLDDDPRHAELEERLARAERLGAVLVLKDPRVWTFGCEPLQGPLTPPFVRVDVASITAWWSGITGPASTR